MSVGQVKKGLRRTFATFFGRFDQLTPIQLRAIPVLLTGKDALLCAPTASGKTEAFAAPAAELVLNRARGRLRVLVVSPTRALANDLQRRLEGRISDLGISMGRYTGEHKERVERRFPEVTITTPEALDSLLARRPQDILSVRMVVCEEVHILDGTPRGDQLRIDLYRLASAVRHCPQRVVTSATIDAPQEVAGRYLEDGEVFEVGGARRVYARCFSGRASEAMAQHLDDLAAQGFRKILVFCNRRADVERLATKLAGRTVFAGAIFPHHGSLSQSVRERTERRFNEAPAAVAIATMTLELGIDIGSVDYVLLDGPPPDVASLMQRMGRGGRRTEASRVGCAVADRGEQMVFDVLLRAGVRGHLLAAPYAFRPGVLVQQALVRAATDGWVDEHKLQEMVPEVIWETVAPSRPRDILQALVDAELLEPPRSGRYVVTEAVDRRYQRGVLHSNIESGVAAEIVDRLSGETIGQVERHEMRRFQLGGRSRKVVRQSESRLLTDPIRGAGPTHFASRWGRLCSHAQARAVVEGLGVREGEIVQLTAAGSTLLLHGLGTTGSLWFTALITKRMPRSLVEKAGPYLHRLARALDRLPDPLDEDPLVFVGAHEGLLRRRLAMGPWHDRLPAALRRQALLRAANLERVAATLRKARLVTVEDPSAFDLEMIRHL